MDNLLSTIVSSRWILVSNVLVVLLLLLLGWKVLRKDTLTIVYKKYLLSLSAILIASFVLYQVYTYVFYFRSPLGRFLLPPHSTFYYQQFGAAFSEILSAFIAATVVLVLGIFFVRKQRVTQFGADDWLCLSIGTLAVGWPAALPFLAVVILLSIFGLIMQILVKKKTLADRLIITPYIMPAAILTLVLKSPLLALTHLDKIRF